MNFARVGVTRIFPLVASTPITLLQHCEAAFLVDMLAHLFGKNISQGSAQERGIGRWRRDQPRGWIVRCRYSRDPSCYRDAREIEAAAFYLWRALAKDLIVAPARASKGCLFRRAGSSTCDDQSWRYSQWYFRNLAGCRCCVGDRPDLTSTSLREWPWPELGQS